MAISTTITPFTKSPSRQVPATFSEDMDSRLSEENSRITQMNAVSSEMNSTATTINAQQIAASTANYKGAYSAGTIYGVSETVSSGGNFFVSQQSGNTGNDLTDLDYWRMGLITLNTGFKNYIINGRFDVWQRGTFFEDVTAGGYTADRWYHRRSSSTPNGSIFNTSTGKNENNYRIRRDPASTETDTMWMCQIIEEIGIKALRGKEITLSMLLAKGGDYSPASTSIYIQSSTDDSSTIGFSGTVGNVSNNTTFATESVQDGEVSVTGTVPSDAVSLAVFVRTADFVGTAGTNDYIVISDVALEKGTAKTESEPRLTALEFIMCLRYFRKSDVGTRVAEYTHEMRIAPSVTGASDPYFYDAEIY